MERQGEFARTAGGRLRYTHHAALFSTLEIHRNTQIMKIEGSIRSNLISAITSVRRWRGRPVHKDTIAYWHGVLEHGRRVESARLGEPVGELVAELESE